MQGGHEPREGLVEIELQPKAATRLERDKPMERRPDDPDGMGRVITREAVPTQGGKDGVDRLAGRLGVNAERRGALNCRVHAGMIGREGAIRVGDRGERLLSGPPGRGGRELASQPPGAQLPNASLEVSQPIDMGVQRR